MSPFHFRSISKWCCLVVFLALSGRASGQGVLINEQLEHRMRLPRPIVPPHPGPWPSPPQTYRVKQLAFQVTLNDQVAKVQVSQSFVNTGSTAMEVSFLFPLPYDGAVDRLTLMVDGKEYEAKLLDAAEARRIYEGYIRRNQDPALLEWMGTGLFKTSVFPVPAGAERTVTMRYSQVCRKTGGLSEFLFPLSTAKYTAQAVEKVECHIHLESQAPLKNVYSPSHAVDILRPSDKQAVISFQTHNETPASDFRLFYDVGTDPVGARVISYRPQDESEGYFLLLVSPEIKKSSDQVLKKNVVFVVDRSGSMSGQKIEQAKGALRAVLNNLREGDLFNIVAYDSEVESFRPELQRFDDTTRQAALGYVSGLYAGGSTNIDGALKVALTQLQDDTRPNYVIFLTDGLPTAGVTNEAQIAQLAQDRNKVRARIFAFGVGYDVNSRLLDKLARSGFGQSEYVRPNEDIEAHVSKLYNRIGAPTLANLMIKFDLDGAKPEQGPAVNRVYPRNAYDLYAGDQLALVGRYRTSGAAKVTVEGKIEGQTQSFHFPCQFVDRSVDDSFAFVEKLWAMRRVGEIIDEIDLKGKNNELIDELVSLSKRHGILTPYTSFLADDRANGPLAGGAGQAGAAGYTRESASRKLDLLQAESGRGGFSQRDDKARLQKAMTAPSAGLGGRFRAADTDEEVEVNTIQTVGRKTFFLRGKQWMDSTIESKPNQKSVVVQRYSPEFFDLVNKFGRDAAGYLAIEGPVSVLLGDTVYELTD